MAAQGECSDLDMTCCLDVVDDGDTGEAKSTRDARRLGERC
jgi:hypothetical protein